MKQSPLQHFQDWTSKATLAAACFLSSGCEPASPEVGSDKAVVSDSHPDSKLTFSPPTSVDATHWRNYPEQVAQLLQRLEALQAGQPTEFETGAYTAVVFLNTNCPLAARYIPKLNALQEHFSSILDVKFLAVFSRPSETTEGVNQFASKYAPTFPIAMDRDAALADVLRAERSPEFFLLNDKFQLIYRGAIDDNQRVRGANPTVRNNFLHEVLQDLVESEPIKSSVTDAEGCFVQRPNFDRIYPTWEKDIGPLIEKNCAGCHSPNEIASILPLTTADEVRENIKTINERIEDGTMPPWREAGPRDTFEHDRRLDPMEKWALRAWEEQGTPGSADTFTIDSRRYADSRHIKDPDLVIEMLNPDGETPLYTIPSEGIIPYKTFIAPTVFEEDKWLIASEVTTIAPQSLHHISVFVLPPDDTTSSEPMAKSKLARAFAAKKLGILPAEYEEVYRFYGPNLTRPINLAGFYAPGEGYMGLPRETGVLIPKGSQLAFECHYVSTGVEVTDRAAIRLKFGEMPENAEGSRVIVRTGAPRILQLQIEPNQEKTLTKTMPVFADAEIIGLRPHMHYRGKEYTCELERPDGSRTTIIHIPVWDVNWERFYVPRDPINVPAGSKLHFSYTWDNTSANLNNPDPNQKTTFGTQLHNEMGLTWMSMRYTNPAEARDAETKLQRALDDPDYGKSKTITE